MPNPDGPLQHCVWFQRAAETTDAGLYGIYVELERLVEQLPGAHDFRAGRNVSPEGFDLGYRDGFMIRFDSMQALNAYLFDETHKAIAVRLIAMIEGGTDGLIVFDLPL